MDGLGENPEAEQLAAATVIYLTIAASHAKEGRNAGGEAFGGFASEIRPMPSEGSLALPSKGGDTNN